MPNQKGLFCFKMGIFDKLKGWFASDEQLVGDIGQATPTQQTPFQVPTEFDTEHIYAALLDYGKASGYLREHRKPTDSEALLASVKNQSVKMHEEILNYYAKKNLSPDEKLLNRLTVENMFYLAMGTAILAKVKKTNLIAQGFFAKMLRKSGPEYFYREVARMAGNKYGATNVENLHRHIQRAVFQLLTATEQKPNARLLVIECAKALYLYGLAVTIKEKEK